MIFFLVVEGGLIHKNWSSPHECWCSANYRPQGTNACQPLSASTESSGLDWRTLLTEMEPCKPVLPLPGTGRLFVMLPWRGRLGDDATLAPHTEFPFPPVWLVVLTTIYSFIHTKKHTMSYWGLFWLEEHIMSRCWRLQRLQAGVRSTNPEIMQRVHEAAWQPPSTGLLVRERAGSLSLTHYHLSEKRQGGQHRGTGLHFPSVAFIIKLCKTRFLNSEQSLDD